MATGEPCKFRFQLEFETNLPATADEYPEFIEELKSTFNVNIEARMLEMLTIIDQKWNSGDYYKDANGMNHITWSSAENRQP